jgi:hypothetical protein
MFQLSKQTYPVQLPFFLILIVGGGVQTESTRHVGHWMAYSTCPGWLWWWRRIWWNKNWQGKPKYSEKTCPSPLRPPQIPLHQTRARNRAAAVGSQRLTAWAMARPSASLEIVTLVYKLRSSMYCNSLRLSLPLFLSLNIFLGFLFLDS